MNPTILAAEVITNESIATIRRWNTGQLIGFRFLFLFFMLFIIIQNNGAFPYFYYVLDYPTQALHVFIPWVGRNILSLSSEITVFTNGSGDTTYDYVVVFTIAAFSFLGMILWSALDRKRENYSVLFYWLTVAVRFYVGLMLIDYGLVKVFKLQFPSPGLYRLTQTYGDSSPMGLAWTFLGFSTGYNLFMGMAEVAAVLLLFRRTMTLGAIITLMTTANVMAVNYFYDVPVKILSTALFVMTAFLLVQNIRPLFDFLIRNVVTKLDNSRPVAPGKRWRMIMMSAKVLVILYVLPYEGYATYQNLSVYGDLAPKPPLYGLYQVKHFILGSDTLPPLLSDETRWKHMSIERAGFLRINHMTDSVGRFFTKIDTTARTMEISLRTDTAMKFNFKYLDLPGNEFVLHGRLQNDSAKIIFDRATEIEKEFLLTRRGFNWINEYPYNR
jgi:hypothetical protein